MPINPKPARSKLFLVDDHPLVREHLRALIQQEADLQVCGEAEDAPTALSLIHQQRPDLVILDISLKRSHGLELLKDLKAQRPELPVLVLSMHDEALYAERMLRAGARGYITKAEATLNVMSAIRKVLGGQVYLSEALSARLMNKLVSGAAAAPALPVEVLSDRELEVYQMIGRGLGTREIAEYLRVGIKTVESYKARIREKLQLADGNQLLQHAIQWVQFENIK
jgi:DNA-binding NarL/FixJ family response regulator